MKRKSTKKNLQYYNIYNNAYCIFAFFEELILGKISKFEAKFKK